MSNGGWIDGNTADGMRLTLADDYSDLYVYNLRGNARTAGELRQREKGNVFGSGGRTTIAIFIGVKDPTHTGHATIHYRDIGDYLTRDDKLHILDTDSLPAIDWSTITPNAAGDWINQRDDTFSTFPAIGDKDGTGIRVFDTYSGGLKTNRDVWCYNASRKALVDTMRRMIAFYNQQTFDFTQTKPPTDRKERAKAVDRFIDNDPAKISWNASTKHDLARNITYAFDEEAIRLGAYRPFEKRWLYFDRKLNERTYQLPTIFPTSHHMNIGIVLTAPASHFDFTPFVTKELPNLHTLDTGQFFPRYTYRKPEHDAGILDFSAGDCDGEVDEWGYQRVDNITDEIASRYRSNLGDDVTKDDIFCFVYGLLHSPAYRETYAADLKKMLPRIPTPESRGDFDTYANAGRELLTLHADYEDVEPYPLDVSVKKGHGVDDPETWRVQKMKWRSKTNHSTIIYNPHVTISGIPEEAERYLLGSRTALGWIHERYQVKTDKDSKIVNDPNNWCDEHDDPTYIVDLIRKVTTVAVETMKIIDSLP